MGGGYPKDRLRLKDVQDLLDRQVRWQKARKDLPWAEKVHMAERVRETILKLRVGVSKLPRVT